MTIAREPVNPVRLEEQTAQHASEIFPILKDPCLYEFMDESPPISEAALRERFRRLETRASADGTERWLNWVVRMPDGRLAGYVQATAHANKKAEIAFVIGKDFWSRGVGIAAARAMLVELMDRHGVVLVGANVDKRNVRSLRLLTRLGLTPSELQSSAADLYFEGALPLQGKRRSK